MVRNALREELAALLAMPETHRNPVIRRSLEEDWLYAADAFLLYGGDVPETVRQALMSAGWQYVRDGNWLLLRKASEEPPANWYEGSFGPEAKRCLSLLKRHPAENGPGAESVQRMLIKAAEEGTDALEAACRAIHRDWAGRLRQGMRLPAVNPEYFGDGKDGETC